MRDVQLLNRYFAGLGVEFRPANLGGKTAIESPGGRYLVSHAHHLDDAVVSPHGKDAGGHVLQPVPQIRVDASGIAVKHPALENEVLIFGSTHAAHDRVIAAALVVLLNVHIDFQTRALLEGAVRKRRSSSGRDQAQQDLKPKGSE